MVGFCRTDKVKGIALANNFIENVRETPNNTIQLHHFHGAGEIIGYSHSYCNQKVRENYFKVLVVAHNLSRFEEDNLSRRKKSHRHKFFNHCELNLISRHN